MMEIEALAGWLTAALDPDPEQCVRLAPELGAVDETVIYICRRRPDRPGEVVHTRLSLRGGALRPRAFRYSGGSCRGLPDILERGNFEFNHPNMLEDLLDYLESLGWAIRRWGLPE